LVDEGSICAHEAAWRQLLNSQECFIILSHTSLSHFFYKYTMQTPLSVVFLTKS